jgi:hypothetical protein
MIEYFWNTSRLGTEDLRAHHRQLTAPAHEANLHSLANSVTLLAPDQESISTDTLNIYSPLCG